jgi:hypothetical protein
MSGMLNNGGHGNDPSIETEEGAQAEGYDIEAQDFFDVPTADCTTFYDDCHGDDYPGRPRAEPSAG